MTTWTDLILFAAGRRKAFVVQKGKTTEIKWGPTYSVLRGRDVYQAGISFDPAEAEIEADGQQRKAEARS